MTQVWSSSTVHFMLQDPLKAIICKILSRTVCFFFFSPQRILQRRKQDSFIQFYVKSNLILICVCFFPVIMVVVGKLRREWAAPLHVSSSFPQVWNNDLAFSPGETAVNLTLSAGNSRDFDHELILLCVTFLCLFLFLGCLKSNIWTWLLDKIHLFCIISVLTFLPLWKAEF